MLSADVLRSWQPFETLDGEETSFGAVMKSKPVVQLFCLFVIK
jgi:hypothetical protein